MAEGKRFERVPLGDLPPIACPCGTARRAFTESDPESPVSVHLVETGPEAELHWHKEHTEIYVILEGQGELELDGERIPVKPLDAILIRPGCRHRSCASFKLLNISSPAFDAADKWKES